MAKEIAKPSEKAKKTRLSKKSNSELIDIILRKDAVERRNNETIKNLKQDIVNWKTNADIANTNLEDYSNTVVIQSEEISKLNKEITKYKVVITILAIAAIVGFIL